MKMTKLEDMEDAAPRYAAKVEVANLRRTIDDFMKTQEGENKSINSKKHEKLLKLAKDPSSTSSVASTTSTIASLSTTEPLQLKGVRQRVVVKMSTLKNSLRQCRLLNNQHLHHSTRQVFDKLG
jgi:hypothetical protein